MASLVAPIAAAHIVEKIEPVLRQHSAKAESERRLSDEVVEAMIAAGVFQSLVPRALGGLELDGLDALQLFEEIARIDASSGWIAANQSGIATLLAVLPEDAAAEILEGGRTLFAGALFPPGAAVAVNGGYRVTGQWPFGSGSDYANWMVGSVIQMDGDTPRLGPDGQPALMMVVFPAADAEVIDTWHTLGMRGTGSKDIRVADIFVPESRTWVIAPGEKPSGAFAGPIYLLGFWPVAAVNAAVGLGIARAAFEDFQGLASKMPAYTTTSLWETARLFKTAWRGPVRHWMQRGATSTP